MAVEHLKKTRQRLSSPAARAPAGARDLSAPRSRPRRLIWLTATASGWPQWPGPLPRAHRAQRASHHQHRSGWSSVGSPHLAHVAGHGLSVPTLAGPHRF
jgi:hypothetical protein